MKKIRAIDIEKQMQDVSVKDLLIRVSVYGFVIKDNKILLLSYGDFGYDLPGGGIELGETPEEALKREVLEETGTIVRPEKRLDFDNSFFKPSEHEAWQSIALYYKCEYQSGNIDIKGFDSLEKEIAHTAEWIDLDKLPKIKVASSIDFRKKLMNENYRD